MMVLRYSRHRKVFIIAAVITVFSLLYVCVLSPRLDRHHVTTMLKLTELPASVSDIECASYGFTDVLERCAFAVDASDFEPLLDGYDFSSEQICSSELNPARCIDSEGAPITNHTFCCGPVVGSDFPVAQIYVANPSTFEHGGSVTVITNSEQTLAMVDLYIE